MKDFPTKDKRRLKRRASEAKALQKRQFRQRIIQNKKKKHKGTYIQDDIREEISGTVYERTELHSIQEQVSPYEGGDMGSTLRDVGDGSVPDVDDEG